MFTISHDLLLQDILILDIKMGGIFAAEEVSHSVIDDRGKLSKAVLGLFITPFIPKIHLDYEKQRRIIPGRTGDLGEVLVVGVLGQFIGTGEKKRVSSIRAGKIRDFILNLSANLFTYCSTALDLGIFGLSKRGFLFYCCTWIKSTSHIIKFTIQ